MTLSAWQWAETINLYHSGLTCEQVGRKLGMSGAGVRYRLKRAGAPRRHSGGSNKLPLLTLRATRAFYVLVGSLRVTGAKFGISHEAIRQRLKSLVEREA